MRYLRNGVKAVIVENGALLAIYKRQGAQEVYVLPGGGQRPGETLLEALDREISEELGTRTQVLELALVWEYCGWKYDFGEEDLHQIDMIFRCNLLAPVDLSKATEPDAGFIRVEWLPLERLGELPLYPAKLRTAFDKQGNITVPVYMGAEDDQEAE